MTKTRIPTRNKLYQLADCALPQIDIEGLIWYATHKPGPNDNNEDWVDMLWDADDTIIDYRAAVDEYIKAVYIVMDRIRDHIMETTPKDV